MRPAAALQDDSSCDLPVDAADSAPELGPQKLRTIHYDWILTQTKRNQPSTGALPSRIVERPHSHGPDAVSFCRRILI